MAKDVVGEIVREYDDQFPIYNAFTEKANGLVGELLKENALRVHSITSRLKDKDVLRDKLSRAEADYSKLSDVTDICGIRIITYFADEVDAVAKVIEQEFVIDSGDSVDKRILLDPDRFGYLSLHYVAKLSPARLKLLEYRRFSECKVEIQIRSILQHTWAEIEHDLGYKSKQSIPKEVRRRFSRLAGLLEIADSEFAHIRDDLEKYAEAVPRRITDAPESVSIDRASLFAFVKENPKVQKLDRQIAANVKAPVVEDQQWLEGLVNNLHYVGLETIADVVSNLEEFADTTVHFIQLMISKYKVKMKEVRAGVSLFYLCYILMAQKGSEDMVFEYLQKNNISLPEKRKTAAKSIMSIYAEAQKH